VRRVAPPDIRLPSRVWLGGGSSPAAPDALARKMLTVFTVAGTRESVQYCTEVWSELLIPVREWELQGGVSGNHRAQWGIKPRKNSQRGTGLCGRLRIPARPVREKSKGKTNRKKARRRFQCLARRRWIAARRLTGSALQIRLHSLNRVFTDAGPSWHGARIFGQKV